MSAPIKQQSFSGGEISPSMYGRTDQVKYETGLRTMRNMIAMRQGGATNRPGTQYIDTTLNGGNAVRLLPFIFNETGNGQSYVLEFGNLYIAFIQDGGRVLSGTPTPIPLWDSSVTYGLYQAAHSGIGFNYISVISNNLNNVQVGNPSFWAALNDWNIATPYVVGDYVRGMSGATPTGYYYLCTQNNVGFNPLTNGAPYWVLVKTDYVNYTITSPYAQADLSTLQFAENADVVTITHPNYPPYELRRLSATNWTITVVTVQSSAPQVTGMNFVDPGAGTWSGTYTVIGVLSTGEESEPVSISRGNRADPTVAAPHQIDWGYVATLGGVTYNWAYFEVYLQESANLTNIGGFIGRTTNGLFYNPGFTPDYSNTPTLANRLFNAVGDYPSTVGFVQQRRAFGNTVNNPIGFWLSQPGFYSNFNTHIIPFDSDAIFGSVAGVEVNSIQHILELKFMLMLTGGAELYLQGNGNGVITPSAINASAQSQYGCNAIRPLRIADTIIFNQALGNTIRDLRFDFVISGYNGNELTVFSSHLFEGYQIVDWDFQKIPDSIVWAVRNDGVLLGLTYMREQQMLAWHRHDFNNGVVENVCCIPENGSYATYLSIKRVINHQTVRYIERMSSRIWSDVLNATYLDCFSSYNGTNMGSTYMTLTAPSGSFDQTSSAYQQHLTLTSTAYFFNASMVGDQIFLSDSDFVLNKGNMVDPENDGSSFALSTQGNQIRCTIIAYTNSTTVTVTPNRLVPSTLQNIPVTTWARAVDRVTGLDYLIGEAVSVWADRTVVASPNNVNVTFQVTVASDGSITLDKHYAVIYVGLPMTSDLETLDIETAFGESMIGRRKRQIELKVYLLKTRTLFAGSENPDSNFDNTTSDPLFQLSELKTGMNRQTYDQPPELSTEQERILHDTRWNKNGRIFIRNVDPTPLTILAVVPGGDYPSEVPQAVRA